MPLGGVGVAPGDREHLLLLAEQPLHHAPPRRDIEDVELVDRRGDEQQRHVIDLVGDRPVLDQLEHVRPREVGRRQCVEKVARRKPRLALGPPVEIGVRD